MTLLRRYIHRPQQVAIRRFNFQIHLWIGILLTLYMVVIGVTGSILVFRAEIERLTGLKPWQDISPAPTLAGIATVAANVRTAYPHARTVSILTPAPGDSTFVTTLQTSRGVIKVASDPRTGEVLGEFPRRTTWLDVLQELHISLLVPSRGKGRMWNGIGAASLLLLNVTGMVIWWPGIRNWVRALKVDLRRNWRRINFDLHVALGFWTILITSFWAISGVYFGWPRQIFQFVNAISPVISARPPAVSVAPELDASEPDLASLLQKAFKIDPGTQLAGIAFPYSRRAPLAILMGRRFAPGYEYVDTVYFDPYNGNYISTWRYGVNQSVGDWIIWLQVPLHFGTHWGLAVKLLWAAAGLALPILTITGLLMYWNRALRRKWRALQKRRAVAVAA